MGGILVGMKPRSVDDGKYFSDEWKKHEAGQVQP
jgi:hypothetical protein